MSGRWVFSEAGMDWLKCQSNTVKDAEKLTDDEIMANLKNAAGALMMSAKKKRDTKARAKFWLTEEGQRSLHQQADNNQSCQVQQGEDRTKRPEPDSLERSLSSTTPMRPRRRISARSNRQADNGSK